MQPIDWTTGAVQALLRTEHPIGTRFLYDYHFYHHVQMPVIQKLRAQFVSQLIGGPALAPVWHARRCHVQLQLA